MKCLNCQKEFKPKTQKKYCSAQCMERAKCKRFYHKHLKEQQQRVLDNYYKYISTEKGLEKIRVINYRANLKRRFGLKEKSELTNKFGNVCVFCGNKDDRIIIHHLDNNGRNKKNPNNDEKNLVPCCHSCHAKIHLQNQTLQMKSKSDTPSNRR